MRAVIRPPPPSRRPPRCRASPSASTSNASISGFDSSSPASRSTTARAAASSTADTVSSTRRPTRTSATPVDPEVRQAALDGPALRVEDARLGRHVDGEPVGADGLAHRAITSSWR